MWILRNSVLLLMININTYLSRLVLPNPNTRFPTYSRGRGHTWEGFKLMDWMTEWILQLLHVFFLLLFTELL